MCKAQYVFIAIVFLLSLLSFGRSQAQTQDLQQPILAAHNPVRLSLHLPSLTWSNELAQYAQQWAQHLATHGCKMQHRQHVGQARLQVGENIYWASPVNWSDGRREVQAINAADVVSAWLMKHRITTTPATHVKRVNNVGIIRKWFGAILNKSAVV